MNLDVNPSKTNRPLVSSDEIDFDFKPITSGLGFHHDKTTEIKPAFTDAVTHQTRPSTIPVKSVLRKENENQFYQNELSIFYGNQAPVTQPEVAPIKEKIIRQATKSQRVVAYVLDLGFVLSCLGLVLTVMARMIHMDLVEVWSAYPNEITPLVVTLFVGFYLLYFSIFEKTPQSTLGKNMVGIKVVDLDNRAQSMIMLMLRSLTSLMNFVSLGLFSYFNLQNKISNTKVIKVD